MSAKGPGGKPTATYGTLTTASTSTTAASGDKVNFSDTKVRSGRAGDRLPWDTSNLEEGKGSDDTAVESTALLQQTLLLARDTEDKGYLTFHTLLQQGDMLKQTREYVSRLVLRTLQYLLSNFTDIPRSCWA